MTNTNTVPNTVYGITATLVVSKEFGDKVAQVGALGGEFFIANSTGRDLAYWPQIKDSSVERVEMVLRTMAGFLEEGSDVVFFVEGRQMPEFRFVVVNGKVERETPRIVWGNSNKGNNQGKQNNNNNQGKQNNNNNGGNKEENGQGNN